MEAKENQVRDRVHLSIVVPGDVYYALKVISVLERKRLNQLVNDILRDYITSREGYKTLLEEYHAKRRGSGA